MGAAVLPRLQISRRAALVPRARACAPRTGISPACVAPLAAADKKPKRPAGHILDEDPPSKRTRPEGEHDAVAAAAAKRPGSFRCGEPPAKLVRGEPDRDAEAAARKKNRPRPFEDSASSARHGVPAAPFAIKKRATRDSPAPILHSTAPSEPSNGSLQELIAKARLAKAASECSSRPDVDGRQAEPEARPSPTAETETIRRDEIARRRAAARWELEQMVATVEFNDPFIDPTDVLK